MLNEQKTCPQKSVHNEKTQGLGLLCFWILGFIHDKNKNKPGVGIETKMKNIFCLLMENQTPGFIQRIVWTQRLGLFGTYNCDDGDDDADGDDMGTHFD